MIARAKALFAEFRTGQGLKGQLLRGGVGSVGVKIVSTILSLVLAIVLARLLGAEGFGVYSFVFALVTIMAIPAQAGLPNLVVRETAKAQAAERWDIIRGLWRWSTMVALAMSAILVVLGLLAVWIFYDRIPELYRQTFLWSLPLIPLIALGNLRGAALRGLRKVVQGQLPEFVIRPAVLIVVVGASWLLATGVSPAGAMSAHVLASIVAFSVGAVLLIKARPEDVAARSAQTEARRWLAAVLPFALISGTSLINQQVGVVALGLLSMPTEIADYRVGMQGGALVAFGLSISIAVLGPYTARLYAANDRVRLQRLATGSARLIFAFALMAFAVLTAFGGPLIALLFGAEYAGAYLPLVIVCFGQLVNTAVASVGNLLSMSGNEREVVIGIAIGAVVNVVLSIVLIPEFGATGAALAAVASLVTWNLILWYRASTILDIDTSIFGRKAV